MGSPGDVTLIHSLYTVPVRPAGVVYKDHCVALRDDLIVGVFPVAQARQNWPDANLIELPEHVLLPGLINAHTHSPMTLLRGIADDMELHVWLKEHIWPAEQKFVGPEFVGDGTRLAIAEMIRAGTTCFNDMYFFPDATIEACVETGMRASIGITIIEIESAWATGVDDYIEKGLQLVEKWQSQPLRPIRCLIKPWAGYQNSQKTKAFLCTYTSWKPNGRSNSHISSMICTRFTGWKSTVYWTRICRRCTWRSYPPKT